MKSRATSSQCYSVTGIFVYFYLMQLQVPQRGQVECCHRKRQLYLLCKQVLHLLQLRAAFDKRRSAILLLFVQPVFPVFLTALLQEGQPEKETEKQAHHTEEEYAACSTGAFIPRAVACVKKQTHSSLLLSALAIGNLGQYSVSSKHTCIIRFLK